MSKGISAEKRVREAREAYNIALNTIYGSLIASVNALNEDLQLDELELCRRMSEAKFPFVDDPEFIKKTVEAVGFDYKKHVVGKPLAVFTTKHNSLILPYEVRVNNDDGDFEIVALPCRRDGVLQRTALHYEEYHVLDWSEE